MCISLKTRVKNFQSMWRERSPSLPLLRVLNTHEIRQRTFPHFESTLKTFEDKKGFRF